MHGVLGRRFLDDVPAIGRLAVNGWPAFVNEQSNVGRALATGSPITGGWPAN